MRWHWRDAVQMLNAENEDEGIVALALALKCLPRSNRRHAYHGGIAPKIFSNEDTPSSGILVLEKPHSSREKTDKPFNWMRPTAKQVGDDICIQCFPGEDHVEHYAALLAAHLRITQGADRARDVFYRPVPDGETIRTLREDTNLLRVPQTDIVVTGLVHRLGDLTGNARFEGGNEEEFGWVLKQFGDQKVLFLGCRFSFWGSISGDLVRVLAQHTGARRVLYFGKLGTTQPHLQPNRWLASGSTSTILGREVKWQNVLEPSLRGPDIPIIFGKHETLPSVLFETKNWLSRSTSFGHQFVDPEVGCMALAAVQSGIEFGYIHAISDNVASKYDEDLSNERQKGVLKGRANLYAIVNRVLHAHLDSL
ncbi:hypothetical protein BT96DRAFT_969586 [Gymnopus androsaceus JB14]|uniref:Nucleoside phosphorylase domain-containing protein n=1 Tax=Gymnopus androsaceus JB14 TaxID=1447944 RepID=A0A6A4IR20_9AGAR|nr:hypothetical protein BT96DRAFT_969586 [Gymnopus androsaceus JB14]